MSAVKLPHPGRKRKCDTPNAEDPTQHVFQKDDNLGVLKSVARTCVGSGIGRHTAVSGMAGFHRLIPALAHFLVGR